MFKRASTVPPEVFFKSHAGEVELSFPVNAETLETNLWILEGVGVLWAGLATVHYDSMREVQ